jgi:hypothetical protein
MTLIHKTVLVPYGITAIPTGRLLSVGWQGRDLCVWYETGTQMHQIAAVPTGSAPPEDGEYVGTAQTADFAGEGFPFMVFHVYARSEPEATR